MDQNEFRAEIAEIFHEQDRRMEKLDKKIEKNAQAMEKNARAIGKLTGLWTAFVETYPIRDVQKDEDIAQLDKKIKRIEGKLGLN